MQRALATALVVKKKGLAVAQHNIARLKIPVEKIVMAGAEEKLRQAGKVMFQRLFVEGYAGKPQEIILEIVQIPRDGLAIEAGARIAHFVIQIAACLNLETRQSCHDLAICFNRLQRDGLADTIHAEKIKECRVSQIFFQAGPQAQVLRINLRHRQSVPSEMPGELKEGDILLAYGIQNADRTPSSAAQPDDGTPRATELTLKRLYVFGGHLVMLLEKSF